MMMVDADEGPLGLTDMFGTELYSDNDDVIIDFGLLFGDHGGVPDHSAAPEGSSVEGLSSVDGLKGKQNSAAAHSVKDESPDLMLSLMNNSDASDSWTRYSNGFDVSDWNSDIPDSQRLENTFQNENEIFYADPHALFPYQNDDSYRKKLNPEVNLQSSFASAENVSTIDGEHTSINASHTHTESSSCEITGTDNSDTLSENGDLNFWNSDDPSYIASTTSGFEVDPFTFIPDDGITGNYLSPLSTKNYDLYVKNDNEEKKIGLRNSLPSHATAGETIIQSSTGVALDWHPARHVLEQHQTGMLPHTSRKEEFNFHKIEVEVPSFNGFSHSKMIRNNISMQSNADSDPDVCILEDRSAPAYPSHNAINGKSQFLASRVTGSQMAIVPSRPKLNDERVIFREALQDLSQPKSEATPPDGVLSVSLLKHQRIALSWMVNKETKSGCCTGGILADDQGLGKTISTIALILKERSPSSKQPKIREKCVTEMLNLEEDDEGVMGSCSEAGVEPYSFDGCPTNAVKTSLQATGRPSGGTLIVCPTSVLRQWSEELHNKVTSGADLSVLVYYGGNRTKDSLELAKYDVVVTTYAIVSMEVPKQPVVNENDDEMGSSFKEFSSSRKRKPTSDDKSSMSKKSRKGSDNEVLESMAGPLAKVGWFRVVLDEAQSIKNHRTQVARACWGLRAKRRWCLSGTPIQNAIDDLYSYFRFLRHEPYAVFRTFRDQLKVPIQRNPKNGYKKLQAVLKTIMLRRTKGTQLDGEPIIDLPPKTIKLKKITFSQEERDFYCRLEADSRAQFAEYARAGTVKQNYVNILLMLLRLRQACDHPLLVKGFNSNSTMACSIEVAKKLSREKQMHLLNCLEASLAICGICNDPPEDAVVTICGHVFCNQCICEHMIGDDTHCPTNKCKSNLTMASVFSITTLRTALSNQPIMENGSVSEVVESSEPHSLRSAQDSSKIKAALNLLLSISRRPDSARVYTDLIEGGSSASEKLLNCDSVENNGTSDINNANCKTVGQKAIVFSQWTGMLDLLETCLKDSSIEYRRLDGTMAVAARDRAVKDFNTLPQVSVMIMSLKAASLGLNMVAACNVVLLDLWWNPTTEDQAIDRAHRIGQTRPVSVFRLTVKDTVEDRILALQQRKRKMVASAFGEDETNSRQTRLTVDDLKYLFRG